MVANYQACCELYHSMFPSGTQQFTDMPKGESDGCETERWAEARWNQAKRMERSLADMQLEYIQVEQLINTVTGDFHTVLIRRYTLNESWETISSKLHVDRTTVWRWHSKAIDRLIKIATPCNIKT
jgi:DNA-directed RNA polymerase specialized sigma24 family protein